MSENRRLTKSEIVQSYFKNMTLANNYYERWMLTESNEMWDLYRFHTALANSDKNNINPEVIAC